MEKTQREHLLELLKELDKGILATRTAEGGLHGRPMDIARVESDGTLYFAAGLDSPKIGEIAADSTVGFFAQDAKRWVSLSCQATVVKDRALIHELWEEDWKVWFPKGKEDPNLCLLKVTPENGEYWDVSGQRGVQFLWEAAKAYVAGEKPASTGKAHAKVTL